MKIKIGDQEWACILSYLLFNELEHFDSSDHSGSTGFGTQVLRSDTSRRQDERATQNKINKKRKSTNEHVNLQSRYS